MSSRRRNKEITDGESNQSPEIKKRRTNSLENIVANGSADDVDIFGDIVNNEKAYPALLRLSSGSSPIKFSSRKRKSLTYKPNLFVESDIELNDDEAEIREEKKRQELVQKEKRKETDKDAPSSLNFSLLTRMSPAELKEHVMQCVKLNTENKITIKNAFTLQLIDCMTYMLKKDKSSSSDFSTMACTLDASAKIYSVRVDSVCNDMSKLVDSFLTALKKPSRRGKGDDEADENDDDEDEKTPRVRRLRRASKRNPVLASEESLMAKAVAKNFLRNYMKLEVGNGALMSSCVWDPVKMQPSLEKSVPLIHNYDEQEEETCEVDIYDFFTEEEIEETLSKMDVTDEVQNDTESNIGLEGLFLEGEGAEVGSTTPDLAAAAASVHEEISAENCNDWEYLENDISLNDSAEEEPSTSVEKKISCATDVIREMEIDHSDINEGDNLIKRTEKLQAMFDKGNSASEYSYLEQTYSPVWTGPNYWKKSYKGRAVGNAKKGGKKKKDPTPINFVAPFTGLKGCPTPEISTKLSMKTMKNWKDAKIVMPVDLRINPDLFIELFLRTKDKSFIHRFRNYGKYLMQGPENATAYSADLMAITEEVHDSPDDDNGNDGIGSPQHEFDSFEELPTSKGEDQPRYEEGTGVSTIHNPDILDGSNLVAAPRMVAVQSINYATRPNNVDMKELKQTLNSILAFDNQNKENKGPEDNSGGVQFSEVYHKLCITQPTPDDEQEISSAMAVLALLHLANENNYKLCNTSGDITDFTILPESKF